ncbi:glycosyltransferase family 4 protein, partial [Chromatiaceae bacterium AAb-1]|nr:glycosyltransferase family 4 protein [Chromatiaceae bacterium AAb-1]
VLDAECLKYDIKYRHIFSSNYVVRSSSKSFELASKIVLFSNASKNSFLKRGFEKDRICVINPGKPREFDNSFSEDKKYAFVSTAFHSLIKGTHKLLLAWREANIVDIPLIIVGELHEDMKEFLAKYGPFDNVQFVGSQKIDNFYKQYNAVGILCSLSEGSPRAVLEYMANSFPVIVSPVATCDLVKHGENGFIADSVAEIINALRTFSDNRELFRGMGESALSSINALPQQHYAEELVALFRELLDEN